MDMAILEKNGHAVLTICLSLGCHHHCGCLTRPLNLICKNKLASSSVLVSLFLFPFLARVCSVAASKCVCSHCACVGDFLCVCLPFPKCASMHLSPLDEKHIPQPIAVVVERWMLDNSMVHNEIMLKCLHTFTAEHNHHQTHLCFVNDHAICVEKAMKFLLHASLTIATTVIWSKHILKLKIQWQVAAKPFSMTLSGVLILAKDFQDKRALGIHNLAWVHILMIASSFVHVSN